MNYNNFDCIVIGNGVLTKLCIQFLINNNFNVVLVATSNIEIKKFCESKNINNINDEDIDLIKQYSFDYLFSIVYLNIINQDIIEIPNIKAINYHDSFLPYYAGINTTSWAIINGEKYHGVTWHVMGKEVDKGSILSQKQIELDKEETSYSLNLKCLYSGFKEFKKLINNITNNTLNEINQNLKYRTYYGKFKKPLYCGIVNTYYYKNSYEVDCLIRGLNFGKIDNTLATAKIYINNKFYIIESHFVMMKNDLKDNLFKIILDFDNKYIVISRIRDIYGNEIELEKEFKFNEYNEIYLNRIWKNDYLFEIGEYFEKICRYENYWVEKFQKIKNQNIKNESFTIDNKNYNYKYIKEFLNEQTIEIEDKIILTILMIYKQITNKNTLCIGYDIDFSRYNNLYSNIVPFIIEFDENDNINELIKKITKEKQNINNNKTYCKDIFFRYNKISEENDLFNINIYKNKRNIYYDLSAFNILIEDGNFKIISSDNILLERIINDVMK